MCYVWRHMDRIDYLRELLQPVLDECDVRLYEIKWLGGKDHTLQVAIMKSDGSMDLDTCADVSEKLSEVLDAADPIKEEYTLEVCSPGAEREIRDLNELDEMAGSYVYVRLREPFKKMLEFTGEIQSVENGVIRLEYRDKAVKRTAEFSRDNIEFIRLAVRL